MTIAMVIVAWTVGSLLLGLVLWRLFGAFAARRDAEEKLFAWLDQIRILSVLGRRLIRRPGCPSPGPFARPDSILELDEADWASQWQAHQRGRMIQ